MHFDAGDVVDHRKHIKNKRKKMCETEKLTDILLKSKHQLKWFPKWSIGSRFTRPFALTKLSSDISLQKNNRFGLISGILAIWV